MMAQHESEKNLEGHKRVLGLWGFAAVAYFAVAGGPFGIEAAVMHAGPLPCFIGFLVLPIVWSLPQALMTAELATLLPDNGGYVLWVTHAFGDFAGWIAGLNGVIGSVVDLTLYPVLFGDIIVNSWMGPEKPNFGIIYAFRLLLVVVGVLLNLRGVSNVSIVSMIISFGIVIPFVISLFAQLPAVSHGIHASGETAAILDWTAFLSTMLWSFTGWDSLGCIAGEVINPKRTFFLGTVITMAFVTVSYTLTLLVSITTHPDYWNWDQGSFAKFAGDVGSWLGIFATTAALLAQLGIFSTGLSTSSRAVWALAGGSEVHPALLANGGGTDSNVLLTKMKEYTAVVHLPKFLAIEWTPTGVPVTSIFAHGLMICLMCLVPFDTLVQADVMLSCIRLLLEVLAFIWLRMQEPAALRDTDVFIVPGGWFGLIATSLPVLAVIGFVIIAADPLVWLITVLINIFGMLVFGVRAMYDRKLTGRWWPRGHCNLGTYSKDDKEITRKRFDSDSNERDAEIESMVQVVLDDHTSSHIRRRDRTGNDHL